MIARAALSGYVERSVGEATNYHAAYVAPSWASAMTVVAMIGQHIFYRLRGGWGQPSAFSSRDVDEAEQLSAAARSTRPNVVQRLQAKEPDRIPHVSYRIAALLNDSSPTASIASQPEASTDPNGTD